MTSGQQTRKEVALSVIESNTTDASRKPQTAPVLSAKERRLIRRAEARKPVPQRASAWMDRLDDAQFAELLRQARGAPPTAGASSTAKESLLLDGAVILQASRAGWAALDSLIFVAHLRLKYPGQCHLGASDLPQFLPPDVREAFYHGDGRGGLVFHTIRPCRHSKWPVIVYADWFRGTKWQQRGRFILAALSAMRKREGPLAAETLARHAGISTRTLFRLFKRFGVFRLPQRRPVSATDPRSGCYRAPDGRRWRRKPSIWRFRRDPADPLETDDSDDGETPQPTSLRTLGAEAAQPVRASVPPVNRRIMTERARWRRLERLRAEKFGAKPSRRKRTRVKARRTRHWEPPLLAAARRGEVGSTPWRNPLLARAMS